MNRFIVCGKLTNDAEIALVNTLNGEKPLVKFYVCDNGMPYQRSEAMVIEVNFIKEAASHIKPYLVKDKEVYVDGFMKQKKMKRGETKYYVSAEYVGLIPLKK